MLAAIAAILVVTLIGLTAVGIGIINLILDLFS